MNQCVRFDPLLRSAFRRAERICVTSETARKLIPAECWAKADVQLAIGIEPCPSVAMQRRSHSTFEVLYAGHLLEIKGVHLALAAFAQFHRALPNSRFTLIGEGGARPQLDHLARWYGIEGTVDFRGPLPRRELLAAYPEFDLLLFPSLRDSGGMVVLEAMQRGLPAVVLDLGGPGRIVTNACGRVIRAGDRNESQVVADLAHALIELASHRPLLYHLGNNARRRAQEFSWERLVETVYPSAARIVAGAGGGR